MAPTRLSRLLVRYWRFYLTGVIALIVTRLCGVRVVWMLKRGIEAARAADGRLLAGAAIAICALAVGQCIIRVVSRVMMLNGGRLLEYDLRRHLMERLHRLGPSFYRRMPTGEIMSRATNDLTQLRLLFGPAILNLVDTIVVFATALPLMIVLDWKLTLVAFAPSPIFFLIYRVFGRRLFAASRATQEALGQMSDRAQQSLAGVRVVRSYSLEPSERRDFDRMSEAYLRANMTLVKVRGTMWPVMGAASGLGTLIVLWYGGTRLIGGHLSLGSFVAFNGYLAMLAWPMLALGWLLGLLQRGRASYDRIRDVLDAVPDVVDAPAAVGDRGRAPVEGALEVRGLSFAHEATRVLDGVSLSVPARGMIAVVGRTGCGKSTAAQLLMRLEPTPRGTVFLDGRDVTELPLAVLRRAIGYAPQEPFLFSTTIARNIAYALPDPDSPASLEKVRVAARAAAIDEEIESFPDGYDTVVGERGVQLSGGQKQRVALARALVAAPPVLLLDDPLSAVDARTEARILQTIAREQGGRTIVLITHRVAAARHADSIVVLEKGRIVERGTHDELVAREGLYRAFFERQQIEEELEALGAGGEGESGQTAGPDAAEAEAE